MSHSTSSSGQGIMQSAAFVPIMSTGHLNPMLALAKGMADKGVKCTFYLKEEINCDFVLKISPNFSVTKLTPSEDKEIVQLLSESSTRKSEELERDVKVNPLITEALEESVNYLECFLEDLIDSKPDVVIYDPFHAFAYAVACNLQIPCVATVTYPGVNVFPSIANTTRKESEQLISTYRSHPYLSNLNQHVKRACGVDILEHSLPLSNIIGTGFCLCTGIEEFEASLPTIMKETYGEIDSRHKAYVGPMLLEKGRVAFASLQSKVDHSKNDDALLVKVKKAKDEGKKVIYCSMGTVTTSFLWDLDFPGFNFGAKTTGKTFCRAIWEKVFKALGDDEQYVCVMATVTEDPKALDGLEVPSNFIVQKQCPQLEILKHADAFITHGGANSMMESIVAGVPMIVLPYFADQYQNARSVAALGLGIGYSDPVADATASTLKTDLASILGNHDKYSQACKIVSRKLQEAGGAQRAIKCIEEYVSTFEGHVLISARFMDLESPLDDEDQSLQRSNSCGLAEEGPLSKIKRFLNLSAQ